MFFAPATIVLLGSLVLTPGVSATSANASCHVSPRRHHHHSNGTDERSGSLKCLTRHTFALCVGKVCEDMGKVANGTACHHGIIVLDHKGANSTHTALAATGTAKLAQNAKQGSNSSVTLVAPRAPSRTPRKKHSFRSSATPTGSSSSHSKTVSSSAAASSSTSSSGISITGMQKNGIMVGFLPDDGSGGGTSQLMSEINSAIAGSSATYGYYAQAQSGTLFDGSQLTSRMDDIVKSGGIFQPAVMPTGGWWGLTSSDNQQAVAICKVMRQFTDKGLQVWLRFAHEVNYYQTDGTYQGSASDFKEGWAAVAAACKTHAPEVKMWFTPNVADASQYDEYYPDDPSTVDIIGIDYYPQQTSGFDFVKTMKPFHDKYTKASGPFFAIGETGLGVSASIGDRLAWLQEITSSATTAAMPNFKAVSWFNYQKGYDFRIAATGGDTAVKAYLVKSS